jgi:RimJ/RimL family protein N-acetyltransferase
VATTALALFVCRLTVRPLFAYVAGHHAASMIVLEKCGFQPEPNDPDDALVAFILAS